MRRILLLVHVIGRLGLGGGADGEFCVAAVAPGLKEGFHCTMGVLLLIRDRSASLPDAAVDWSALSLTAFAPV
jgi:hypothetical protein